MNGQTKVCPTEESGAEDVSGGRRQTRGNVWLSLGHDPHFARYELALYDPARAA